MVVLVRESGREHEYLRPKIFWKRPDVAVLCVFSSNTIACSCSMSATGAPSKALKVRPPAAKHYQLRHSCPLPNSLVLIATSRSSLQLIIYPGRGLETGAGRLLIMGSKSTRENSSIKIQKILMIVNSWSQIKPKMSNSQSR